jgi:rhodanese-related sulfurtransferase
VSEETVSEETAIAPERAAELLGNGAQAIDVRTPEEHQAGHIAGDRHIPLDEVDGAAGTLDRSAPVIFYCRGGERSQMAAEAFAASGWSAYSIEGGLAAWADRGLPLEPEGGLVAERSNLPPR